ncbi:hypothetical protein TNCV_1783771 [Trichonephila clavipes]|nr:hypothetical protein TNCV_1783771 [Trichonephila clavipes]
MKCQDPCLEAPLLACRRSSNCNDLLPNMKTQRSAVSLKRLLPDTGLRVLRTQVPESIPADSADFISDSKLWLREIRSSSSKRSYKVFKGCLHIWL